MRASTMTALVAASALAAASAGAAMAQQADGGSTPADRPGAPASEGTGLKGVYSTKSVMGISTGTPDAEADAPADASGKDDASAQAGEADGQEASN